MARLVTVRDLKAKINAMPDEALVLVPGSDHSYRPPSLEAGTAALYRNGALSEDFGDLNPDDGKDRPKIVKALIVR